MVIFYIFILGNDRSMEGEVFYYLGLVYLVFGEYEIVLIVSRSEFLIFVISLL